MKIEAVVLVLSALLPAAAFAQEWRTYTFPDPGFSVEFPADPQVQTATVRNPSGMRLPMTRYSARQDGQGCSVSVVDYTGTNADALSTIAETVRALRATGNVTDVTGARLKGVVGRDLTLEAADGSRSKIAVFFFDRHLYTATGETTSTAAAAGADESLRCRQSLQFTRDEGELGRLFTFAAKAPATRAAAVAAVRVTTDAACAGKAPGDAVQLQGPGGPIAATCTLVARPDPPSGAPQPAAR